MDQINKPTTNKGVKMAKDTQTVDKPEVVSNGTTDSVLNTEDVTIIFNTNELEVLVNLLDTAVRAQGLNAAQGGFVLASKIQQALTAHRAQ